MTSTTLRDIGPATEHGADIRVWHCSACESVFDLSREQAARGCPSIYCPSITGPFASGCEQCNTHGPERDTVEAALRDAEEHAQRRHDDEESTYVERVDHERHG